MERSLSARNNVISFPMFRTNRVESYALGISGPPIAGTQNALKLEDFRSSLFVDWLREGRHHSKSRLNY